MPRSPRLLAAFGDERLVEQLRRGNAAAFETVYDRHHRGILSFCRQMLGSREEAEDAVQHTFAAAHQSLLSGDREVRLKPWLYTIARNRCLSVLRSRREEVAVPDDVPTGGLSEEVERRADLRELLVDMAGLPERQRAALVLSELGDLAHSDVADVLGCEPSQVKSLVFQARTSLIEGRKARQIPCAEIREQLATGHGGVLRRGPLRRHLRTCAGCAEFRDDVRRQRRMIAAVLPVIPTLGLKESALAAAGVGAAAGGGGAAAGVVGGGFVSALGGKGVATAVTALVLTGGAGAYDATHDGGVLGNSDRSAAQQAPAGAAGGAPQEPGRSAGAPATERRDERSRTATERREARERRARARAERKQRRAAARQRRKAGQRTAGGGEPGTRGNARGRGERGATKPRNTEPAEPRSRSRQRRRQRRHGSSGTREDAQADSRSPERSGLPDLSEDLPEAVAPRVRSPEGAPRPKTGD